MADFKRIFVPTDLSEPSRIELDYALVFADTFGADLTLFYADPMHFEFDLLTGAPVYVAGVNAEDRARLEKDVRAWADRSVSQRPYRVIIGAGDPVAAIVRESKVLSSDLIVMATHGLSGWRRTAIGSVTEGVVHEANCPVLSVARTRTNRRDLAPGVTRIVCPVNFSAVAREALRSATRLAKMFNCELVIVHVIESPNAEPQKADEERIRTWIAPDVQKNCTYREIVLRGGAAERVLDYVDDVSADLLVIGAQRQLFKDSTVVGTTTERLIRFSRVPVLTIVRAPAAAEQAA
jgi:nucleotide-binding universal stress UspA family protein